MGASPAARPSAAGSRGGNYLPLEGRFNSRGGRHAERGLLLGALALVALALAGTATSASALAALLGMSSDSAGPPPGLIVKIKKTKIARSSSCAISSTPRRPVRTRLAARKGTPRRNASPPERRRRRRLLSPRQASATSAPIKAIARPRGLPAECADRKAAAEKLNVTPFLKWSCICK